MQIRLLEQDKKIREFEDIITPKWEKYFADLQTENKALQKKVGELENDVSMYKGGRNKWHKLYLSMKPYQEYFEMTKALVTLPDDEKEIERLTELILLLNKQK